MLLDSIRGSCLLPAQNEAISPSSSTPMKRVQCPSNQEARQELHYELMISKECQDGLLYDDKSNSARLMLPMLPSLPERWLSVFFGIQPAYQTNEINDPCLMTVDHRDNQRAIAFIFSSTKLRTVENEGSGLRNVQNKYFKSITVDLLTRKK
ncbi:hypothetical protein E2C01_015667 [Portunus trituberculatus]|uniref:Uncharacterized protein n=1 Tax=Portunus trituberculatus TaxID=210409 RepID=A0A5B7DNF1_PORTR|nr:hypothetical protein [Portunus trituberculatus]